jgi:hypothetical protein
MLVILSACLSNETIEEDHALEVSPIFSIPVTFGDGKEGEHVLIGEKGKVAFLIASGVTGSEDDIIEIEPFRTNQPDKYMWYLWGEDVSNKPFKVMGTNTDTDQELVMVEERILGTELNGSDAHIPSTLEFPTTGIWKLDAYVDGKLFGNVIVEVK